MTAGLWADITDGCDLPNNTLYLSDNNDSSVLYNTQSHCSYCNEYVYNNNTSDWVNQMESCEDNGNAWIIDYEMTELECFDVASINGQGGWWFTGDIDGYPVGFALGSKIA